MGAWADLAFPTTVMQAIEPSSTAPTTQESTEAKQGLVDRLRLPLSATVEDQGVTETAFFDGLAGLGTGTDSYDALLRMLAKQHLYHDWRSRVGMPGIGEGADKRAKSYDVELNRDAGALVMLVRRAIANEELSLTSTREASPNMPVFFI